MKRLYHSMSAVQIVNFESCHASAFKRLNVAWMSRHWAIDEHDLLLLDNPQSRIIDAGGAIFIALRDDVVVGTCCLLKHGQQSYELAKMCVAEEWRGRGVGRQLVRHAISAARSHGASLIYLRTASNLTAAIDLYRKLGFNDLQRNAGESARCDIEMELRL